MGAAASAARVEATKPLDSSDITDLGEAKAEISRLRSLVVQYAPKSVAPFEETLGNFATEADKKMAEMLKVC
jgi:hypothetical protein